MFQLVEDLKYVCDAALITSPCAFKGLFLLWFSSVCSGLNVGADQTSKRALADLPFQGARLFGATLDDIIRDLTEGKSTFLSQLGQR